MVDEKTALASARAQMVYDANKKSQGVTYLLWLILGGVGAHRYYIGRTGSGVALTLLWLAGFLSAGITWIIVGIWWIVDLFLIPGMVREKNMNIADSFAFD